ARVGGPPAAAGGERGAERVLWMIQVRFLQVRRLLPRRTVADENVRAARSTLRVVGLVAVDAGHATVFVIAADRERYAVARQTDGEAEQIARVRLRAFQICLLRPG